MNTVLENLRRNPFFEPLLRAVRTLRKLIARMRNKRALRKNYAYDYRRFCRFGSADRSLPLPQQQQAFLVMLAHSLEKGLALPAPKPGFGQDKLRMLLDRLETYIRQYGGDWASQTSIEAIEAYIAFHAGTPIATTLEPIVARVAALRTASRNWQPCVGGGTKPIQHTACFDPTTFSIERFLQSRHSVRNFHSDVVPREVVQQAISLAQTAPSVCNRQAGRVHVIPRSPLANHVLALQDGNRGFGDTASHILIITVDLRCFLSIGERNQMWIDGGLFAMTLVHAFHGLGVGTCFLNWSADMLRDRQLRQRLPLPEWENVITMLAIGYVTEGAQACISQRRPLEEVLRYHESQINESPACA